jgi:hypothetical protein
MHGTSVADTEGGGGGGGGGTRGILDQLGIVLPGPLGRTV